MSRFPKLHQDRAFRPLSLIATLFVTFTLSLASWLPSFAATRIDLVGPLSSGSFGYSITVLPNGNLVVIDLGYDLSPAITDVGAVYLYNGATTQLISVLSGSHSEDLVGSGGVVVLKNGNFVVLSPQWDSDSAPNVGAVTWGSATSGVNGAVNNSNSLVGTVTGDQVGSAGLLALSNGNYLVRSPFCDNGGSDKAGAVTWGNGNTGISGAVSSSNSLVGNASGVMLGEESVRELSNGNYVVRSPKWIGDFVINRGAVTWGNGSTGTSGVVNSSNSLVGSTKDDNIGKNEVILLPNGNYLVVSPDWDNGSAIDAGAVTWVNGSTGTSGAISSSNSLVGSTKNDIIGRDGIKVLDNSNYLVLSALWDNGNIVNAGAVTWGNGSIGISGVVNSFNSLVGSTNDDVVGLGNVTVLKNNNYVVSSPYWDNGSIANVGAVTAGSGATGISGAVNSSNSLIGSTKNDFVGSGKVTPLSNGNYVVSSPQWDNGVAVDAGAVTWGNGTTGTTGVVNISNSLVGSRTEDKVGYFVGKDDVVALSNGNYVVRSPNWDNGIIVDAGAVTWGDGTSGVSGAVSASNSLIGSQSNERLGQIPLTLLSNGNYVVVDDAWNNGNAEGAGAVTWGDGSSGVRGAINSSNSLVGTQAIDLIGNGGVTALSNGNYVVNSPSWDNGSVVNAGAATWGNGSTGTVGEVSSSNSLVGSGQSDRVGLGIQALKNGNYVVFSAEWNNGSATKAGAVTWGNGSTGISGVVSSNNSLIGSQQDDQVGSGLLTELSNGNFVIASYQWDNGSAIDAGALTWVSGSTGSSGVVNSSNSLVGTAAKDSVGFGTPEALPDGNYLLATHFWDDVNTPDVGAVTWGNGSTGVSGPINSSNSLIGKVSKAGVSFMPRAFDPVNQQMVVGFYLENTVALFRLTPAELDVMGKGVAILDGDNSPVSNDGTDLGAKVVGSGAVAQSFTISNTGDGALTVSAITLSGAQPSDFSISGITTPKVLAPNSTLSFTLNFAPSAVGLRTATVNIASDDGNENPYTFAVQGTGSQHKLTTNKTGSGTGTITLSPADGSYNHNTVVTVTAKADAGSTFAGWSGDCSGKGACSVTMTSAKSVTASFSKNSSGNTQKVYLPVVMK
ncbi:MAG: choice-of-anchor D domain-containing protein [Caldilineaceae bacterium]